MYLHDQAREIEARSKGGPIICKVPRELRARVRFQGGKVHIKDNLHFTKTEDGAVLSGFLGPSEIDEPSTTIHLFADAGEIILEEGSWLQNVLGDSAKDFLRPISS